MADKSVHLSQAKHNEETANKLVNEPPYHDWGITAAFYAAIHYLEFWLFYRPEKHTETSIPTDRLTGQWQYSPHTWREKIVERDFTRDAFKSFRELRDASETARYLSLSRRPPRWTAIPAPDHFQIEDAQDMVKECLETLKKELNIP